MELCETQTYHFKDDGTIPNNALPLVIYRQCLQEDEDAVRATLEANNWGDSWVNGIYYYHHFHSTAHEVLVILQGTATLELGGEAGKTLEVCKGDVLVIPAGVGHRMVMGSPALKVMGAYPDGQQWDIRRGDPEDRLLVRENIKQVPLPSRDPVNGKDGALVELWRKDGASG